MSRSMSSFCTKWIILALAIGFILITIPFYQHEIPANLVSEWSPTWKITASPSADVSTIPNIVHFVHLVPPSHGPTFEFPFRQFIAIYSAWLCLQPEVIYIHTNIEERLIDEVLERSTSPYTRAVQQIPNIRFSHRAAPNHTHSGIAIDKLPNQSDFVRTAVLVEQGGIYLDDDSYVLRDLAPLRTAGFENVVGRQENGQICPAVLLSKPRNKLMQAYHVLQDKAFDPGSWAAHAVDLLTRLVHDFQVPDHQVLILPQETLFPSSWLPHDLKDIYGVHEDVGTPVAANNKDGQNSTDFIENFELSEPETWAKGWRLSYVLHGWNHGIEELEGEEIFGEFGGITLDYVLAQRSNFARAVYPAVKHALDEGFIGSEGAELKSL